MLRAVRQGGGPDAVASVGLPRRVREAVELRLSRLAAGARRLLEVAAVIGREFDVELLALAADLDGEAAADALEEVVRRRLVGSVGEAFRFVHHHVLQAARPALLPRRALLHRRVAEAIEKRHAAGLEPHLGALADHFQRAGVWDRAAVYLQAMGDLARRRGAYREALAGFEAALAAASHLTPSAATLAQEIDLRLGMRYALVPLGEMTRVVECLQPAKQGAETLGDRRRLARTEVFLSDVWRWLGDYARAAGTAERARRLAIEIGDGDLAAFAALFLGLAHLMRGRHAEARPLLEETVAAVRGDDPRETALSRPAVAGAACGWLAWSLALRGQQERVPALLEEALRRAEAVGSPFALAVACGVVGETYVLLEEVDRALPVLERGLDLCRRAEIENRLATLEAATGYARARAGRAADGIRLLAGAIARADAQGHLWLQPRRLAWLADAERGAGRHAAAARTAARSVDLARRIGERDSEALALRVQAAIRSVTCARPSRGRPTARDPAATVGRRRRRRSA
jgi:tetratricopeptide (TPR) repeat protein